MADTARQPTPYDGMRAIGDRLEDLGEDGLARAAWDYAETYRALEYVMPVLAEQALARGFPTGIRIRWERVPAPWREAVPYNHHCLCGMDWSPTYFHPDRIPERAANYRLVSLDPSLYADGQREWLLWLGRCECGRIYWDVDGPRER